MNRRASRSGDAGLRCPADFSAGMIHLSEHTVRGSTAISSGRKPANQAESMKVAQRKEARKAILEALTGHDRVSLQNILMIVPDRENAVALALLDERERERILALLGPQKRIRVKEEIAYQKRLFVRPGRSYAIIRRFLEYFERGTKVGRLKSYIRPR